MYGEPVEVRADRDGRPARFAWRDRLYAVRSVQEHWVASRDWWREPGPVPARPEIQFWQVEACPDGACQHGACQHGACQHGACQHGLAGTYELRLDVAAGAWTLSRVTD